MAIPLIQVTPEQYQWTLDFRDDFASLQGISLATTHPLYSELQAIKSQAGNLHWQIAQFLQLGTTNPQAAAQNLNALKSQVTAWALRFDNFAAAMRGETTATGDLDAISDTAQEWATNFANFVGTVADAPAPLFKQLVDSAMSAGDNVLSAAEQLAALPWKWIFISLAAVIILPTLLDELEN